MGDDDGNDNGNGNENGDGGNLDGLRGAGGDGGVKGQGVDGNNRGDSGQIRKRKIIQVRNKTWVTQATKGPEGNNWWPYSDSYVPKLKLIRDDMIPVKDQLYR